MVLSIKIIDKKIREVWSLLSVKGCIQINDHIEYFYMPLSWWVIEDYEQQWQEGLERIKTHNQSCLITAIEDPRIKPWIEWWILYKVKNNVYCEPYIFFGDIYRERIGIQSFTVQTCYEFIPPRKISMYGEKMPDLIVSLDNL